MERPDLDDRFWSKVDRSGGPEACWPWTAAHLDTGYGRFCIWVDGVKKIQSAHRLSWQHEHGAIPSGSCVLHRCDNPPCVNPAHLFLGTKADNTHDMFAKGRFPIGSKHGNSKLSDDDVRAIRRRHGGGEKQRPLAFEFGINVATMHRLIHGISYKDVT